MFRVVYVCVCVLSVVYLLYVFVAIVCLGYCLHLICYVIDELFQGPDACVCRGISGAEQRSLRLLLARTNRGLPRNMRETKVSFVGDFSSKGQAGK